MDDETFTVDDDFLFVGRTFEEYRRMFDLARADLRGSLLDCPGGPSSFAAVAGAQGATVRAVDPMYERSRAHLRGACADAIERNVAQLREQRDLFVWEFYGDVPTRERYLRAASERFLADRARRPDRYVAAGLPDLPFGSNAFDLALSGNLCFLYDDRLDEAFHVAALRELARVAGEVRVFPLHALDRERSSLVGPVTERLRADGHPVETRPVDYEFQPGATEMLVVGGREGREGAGTGH